MGGGVAVEFLADEDALIDATRGEGMKEVMSSESVMMIEQLGGDVTIVLLCLVVVSGLLSLGVLVWVVWN